MEIEKGGRKCEGRKGLKRSLGEGEKGKGKKREGEDKDPRLLLLTD